MGDKRSVYNCKDRIKYYTTCFVSAKILLSLGVFILSLITMLFHYIHFNLMFIMIVFIIIKFFLTKV